MKGNIDLHTHTTASDGSMKPSELVLHAKESGLKAIAITDHDTVEGMEEALAEGKRTGLEVLPGVEISADYEKEIHILGYFPCGNYRGISDVLEQLKKNRDERNPKIVKKLNDMGMKITMEEVLKEADDSKIIGRPHIAAVLAKKGYVSSIDEAFDKYLAFGRPAYFKKDKLSPGESIAAIKDAGGIAVLAHPGLMGYDNDKLDKLVAYLLDFGLKGIECYYVDHTPDETSNFIRIAKKYDMVVTGGSDFHGSFKPDIKIGTGRGDLHVPYECLEKLKEAFRQ